MMPGAKMKSIMPELTPELRAEYQRLFDTCEPLEKWRTPADHAAIQLGRYRARYNDIGKALMIPWQWIAAIHMMESGANFNCHFHNSFGDPLTSRTKHPPVGRPIEGSPPFHWHTSALDALVTKHLHDREEWDVPAMLYEAERWNTFGYRDRGVNSPYLWAGSQQYDKGLLQRGGTRWEPDAIAPTVGVALLLKRLFQMEPLEVAV